MHTKCQSWVFLLKTRPFFLSFEQTSLLHFLCSSCDLLLSVKAFALVYGALLNTTRHWTFWGAHWPGNTTWVLTKSVVHCLTWEYYMGFDKEYELPSLWLKFLHHDRLWPISRNLLILGNSTDSSLFICFLPLVPNCTQLSALTNGRFIFLNGNNYKSVATPQCNNGFEAAASPKNTSCLGNGLWSLPLPTCHGELQWV